jgi:hypothetical protein
MFIFLADLEKISVLLVAPIHHVTPIPMQSTHPLGLPAQCLASTLTDNEGDNTGSDDGGVEMEKEWLDKAQLTILTTRFPSSRVLEVTAIKVCQLTFFLTSDFNHIH